MNRGLALLVATLLPGSAWAAPEDQGPLEVIVLDAGDIPADTVTVPLKVYYPANGGPAPMVEIIHGSSRSGSYHVALARTLASRGIVALVPTIPCGFSGCDHEANARQILAVLAWAVAESNGSGPLAGRIDTSRQAVLGHSYGGLAAFLAARAPGLQAMVVFDPKDDGRAAYDDAAMITVPTAHLMATVRGACNDDWGDVVYPRTTTPHLRVRVVNAGHCDVEEPGDNLCPFACGSGDPGTSKIFRRYAVAFLGCVLKGDGAYAPYLGGAALGDDVTANIVDQVDHAGLDTLPCQGAPILDAGFPAADTGVAPAADAGVDSTVEKDEGCTDHRIGEHRPYWLLLGLVLFLRKREHQARLAALRTVAVDE